MLASQTRLITAATETRRRIFASLPLHYRLARAFIVLGSDYLNQFARGVYGLFLLNGIKDMPPVDPGSPLARAIEHHDRNLPRHIPSGYARAELAHFARNIGFVATRKVKNPARIPDLLQTVFERLIENKRYMKIDPERGLKAAENYVLTMISRLAIDMHRRTKDEELDNSLTVQDDDGGTGQLDIHDVGADLGDMMDTKEVMQLLDDPFVLRDLAKVHPDARLFITLLLDGYSQKDILGNPPAGVPSMLPHWTYGISAWQPKPDRGYGTKILNVLREHMLDEHVPTPSGGALSL